MIYCINFNGHSFNLESSNYYSSDYIKVASYRCIKCLQFVLKQLNFDFYEVYTNGKWSLFNLTCDEVMIKRILE